MTAQVSASPEGHKQFVAGVMGILDKYPVGTPCGTSVIRKSRRGGSGLPMVLSAVSTPCRARWPPQELLPYQTDMAPVSKPYTAEE